MIRKINKNIVLSGSIGTGKTTILKKLMDKYYYYKYIPELDLSNDLISWSIKETYKNEKSKYMSLIQTHIFTERLLQFIKANELEGLKIYDRSFLDPYVFTELLKEDLTVNEYEGLISIYHEHISKLNLSNTHYILFKCDLEENLFRVENRGRANENIENVKRVIESYNTVLIKLLDKYNVPYNIIDSSKSIENTLDVVESVILEITNKE